MSSPVNIHHHHDHNLKSISRQLEYNTMKPCYHRAHHVRGIHHIFHHQQHTSTIIESTTKSSEIYKKEETGSFESSIIKNAWSSMEKIHITNALLNAVVLFAFIKRGRLSPSAFLSAFSISVNLAALTYDNTVCSIGAIIGKGKILRMLTKGRLLAHSLAQSLLVSCITEIARLNGIICGIKATNMNFISAALTLLSLFRWLPYDTNSLEVVDNRNCEKHSSRNMAQTLCYTSGNAIEVVLPAALNLLYQLWVGCYLISKKNLVGSYTATLFLVSGFALLCACALPNRPDLVQFGETFYTGSVCSVLAISARTSLA